MNWFDLIDVKRLTVIGEMGPKGQGNSETWSITHFSGTRDTWPVWRQTYSHLTAYEPAFGEYQILLSVTEVHANDLPRVSTYSETAGSHSFELFITRPMSY